MSPTLSAQCICAELVSSSRSIVPWGRFEPIDLQGIVMSTRVCRKQLRRRSRAVEVGGRVGQNVELDECGPGIVEKSIMDQARSSLAYGVVLACSAGDMQQADKGDCTRSCRDMNAT